MTPAPLVRFLGIVLGGALGLAQLGCGAKHAPKTHQVEIRAMQFVPAELTVAVGDTIVWTNHDVMPHTVTSEAASTVTFDSQSIESKQVWSYTVTTAGELPYVCTFHPTMRGKLVTR